MAVLPIRIFGDPVLREKSAKVETIDKNLKAFSHDMAETMYNACGVGLAAPQIGVLKQVIVIDMGNEDFVVYINPRLVEASKSSETDDEGCLCMPDIRVPVSRSTRVVVDALDLLGRPVQIEAEDILARALQHEIDHLQGFTILDKTDLKSKRRAISEFMEKNSDEA